MVLEEEIKNLTEKLEKLQRRSGVKYLEVKSSSNFDRQACLLQRRLVKVGATSDETCVKEIREMAEASLSINKTSCRVDDLSFVSNENCHVRTNLFFLILFALFVQVVLNFGLEKFLCRWRF